MERKKRIRLLNLLRVFAVLLVINSHCDSLYPIPALATGGALGNALFFILSGFLLKIRGSFFSHIGKRAARIYPGVLLILALETLLGGRRFDGVGDALLTCVWPTAFWFIGALILFDMLAFWLERLEFRRHFLLFSLIMAVIYFAAYALIVDKTVWSVEEQGLRTPTQWFKLIYYFYIYALGFYLSNAPERTAPLRRNWMLLLACVFFLGGIGVKGLFVWRPSLLALQFLPQLFGVAFAYFALLSALAYENWYLSKTSEGFRKGMGVLAGMSLEIYLTQTFAIRWCAGIFFPLNLAAALAVTLAAAFLLRQFDQWAAGTLTRLFDRNRKTAD